MKITRLYSITAAQITGIDSYSRGPEIAPGRFLPVSHKSEPQEIFVLRKLRPLFLAWKDGCYWWHLYAGKKRHPLCAGWQMSPREMEWFGRIARRFYSKSPGRYFECPECGRDALNCPKNLCFDCNVRFRREIRDLAERRRYNALIAVRKQLNKTIEEMREYENPEHD